MSTKWHKERRISQDRKSGQKALKPYKFVTFSLQYITLNAQIFFAKKEERNAIIRESVNLCYHGTFCYTTEGWLWLPGICASYVSEPMDGCLSCDRKRNWAKERRRVEEDRGLGS